MYTLHSEITARGSVYINISLASKPSKPTNTHTKPKTYCGLQRLFPRCLAGDIWCSCPLYQWSTPGCYDTNHPSAAGRERTCLLRSPPPAPLCTSCSRWSSADSALYHGYCKYILLPFPLALLNDIAKYKLYLSCISVWLFYTCACRYVWESPL